MRITHSQLREIIGKIILAESRYFGMSIQDVLSYLKEFSEHTWVFLDLETTGLNNPAELKEGQITEIAAIAVNPNDWSGDSQIVGVFNRKIELNKNTKWRHDRAEEKARLVADQIKNLEDEIDELEELCSSDSAELEEDDERCAGLDDLKQQLHDILEKKKKNARNWSVPDALEYTNYYGIPDEWDSAADGVLEIDEQWDGNYIDEQVAINEFFTFVAQYDKPVLVIQNAAFDSEWLGVRFKQKAERYPTIDTLKISQLFLTPMLKTLASSGDQDAIDFLSSSGSDGRSGLANISKGFGLSVDGHHTAIVDVKMTLTMLSHVISKLRENPDLNIEVEHGEAVFGRPIYDDEGNIIGRKGGAIASAEREKKKRKWWTKKHHTRAQRKRRQKRRELGETT